MSIYPDVNVLVALFVVDPLNDQAEKTIRELRDDLIVSNLSIAEFSAVIARRVRMRDLSGAEARTVFSQFDAWCADYAQTMEMEAGDVTAATVWMRRLDLPLRTPDALHIAIVQRTGSRLLTFDRAMARVARSLGVAIAKG